MTDEPGWKRTPGPGGEGTGGSGVVDGREQRSRWVGCPTRAVYRIATEDATLKHLRNLLVAVVVPALILVVFAVSSALAQGPAGKSTVCHSAGGQKFVEITVSNNALAAHMNHGDVLQDEYGECP
jgi:hypothetical protein